MNILKRAMLGLTAAASVAVVAAPAEAQSRYYRDHRGNNAGAAIAAGVVGLAVGAALASNRRGYDDRGHYDNGYYDRGHYNRGYYDQGYHNRSYDRGYYQQPHYAYRHNDYRGHHNGYYGRQCITQRYFDEYSGQVVRVRRCR